MTRAARLSVVCLQGALVSGGALSREVLSLLPEAPSSLCLHGARRVRWFSSCLMGGSFSVSFELSPPSRQDSMSLSCLGSVLDHLFSCVYARSSSGFVKLCSFQCHALGKAHVFISGPELPVTLQVFWSTSSLSYFFNTSFHIHLKNLLSFLHICDFFYYIFHQFFEP